MKLLTARVISISVLLFTVLLAGCSGGSGGGGGGGGISGSYNPATDPSWPVHTINVTANVPVTIKGTAHTGSGDIWFFLNEGSDAITCGCLPLNWITILTNDYENYSYIPTANATLYMSLVPSDGFSPIAYTVNAIEQNTLTVDGPSRNYNTRNDNIYYSFEAISGNVYRISLTPSSGNVDIGAVSPNTNMSASVGASTNTGTKTDTVVFTAATTGTHYIRVDSTGVESTYDIQVSSTTADPDLRVSVDGAVSDGTNLTVYYTVYNDGLNAAGPFNVDIFANPLAAPAVGDAGDGADTIVTLAGGSLTSGNVVIATATTTGTAYAVVDTTDAILESDEANNVSSTGFGWMAMPMTASTDPGLPVVIPDADIVTGASSTITLAGPASISKVAVQLDITHTWDADLDIYLESPTGTVVMLSTDNGSSLNNYTGTVFDDGAATSIVSGTAPFTGYFIPEEALSAFNGENANGTWILHVYDDTGADTGTIDAWSISVQ